MQSIYRNTLHGIISTTGVTDLNSVRRQESLVSEHTSVVYRTGAHACYYLGARRSTVCLWEKQRHVVSVVGLRGSLTRVKLILSSIPCGHNIGYGWRCCQLAKPADTVGGKRPVSLGTQFDQWITLCAPYSIWRACIPAISVRSAHTHCVRCLLLSC